MTKKKGFTLVELLAVICIIGVIAVIATPIVKNYVTESKTKGIETSIANIERAVLTYFNEHNTKNTMAIDLTSDVVELANNNIKKGLIIGNRDDIEMYYLYKDGYCAIKENGKETIKKTTIGNCDFNSSYFEVTNNNIIEKNKKIVGYRIYGNTVDNVSLGNNNNQIKLKINGKNYYNLTQNDFYTSNSVITTYDNGYRLTMKSGQTSNSMNTQIDKFLELPKGSYTICAEANFEGTSYKIDGGTPAEIKPVLSLFKDNPVTGHAYMYNKTQTLANGYFIYLHFEITDVSRVRYLRILFNDLATTRTYNTQGIIKNIQILPGTITTKEQAGYEPYLTPKEYTITLNEPLRKYGDAVDYIDSSISQVVRNVGVNADGTLYALDKPTYEYISLPTITNLDGTTIISASDGIVDHSKIDVLIKK